MPLREKTRTILKLAAAGGFTGWVTSLLLGATAIGILGAGLGGPAGFLFTIAGVVIAFAVYGVYRLIKG